jgi:omega-amidase
MNIALIQHSPKLNRSNLDFHLNCINEIDADLIIFPELSLSGYMLQDKLYEDAWSIDELYSLIKASKKIDIIAGLALRESGKIYNSAIYLSSGKVSHIHHKVHLPNYGMFEEARYFSNGDQIDGFESKFGKVAMVVCEDLWHGSTITKLSESGAKFIYVVAASPARGFETARLKIEDEWNNILKSTAMICSSYVIFVNRVGFEDGLGFWGGSKIVDPHGEIMVCMKKFESYNLVYDLDSMIDQNMRLFEKV